MGLNPEEVSSVIQKEIAKYETKLEMESVGTILQVGQSGHEPPHATAFRKEVAPHLGIGTAEIQTEIVPRIFQGMHRPHVIRKDPFIRIRRRFSH